MKTKISQFDLIGRMRPNTQILFFQNDETLCTHPSYELDYLNNLQPQKRKDAKPKNIAFYLSRQINIALVSNSQTMSSHFL